ncbi:MAG: SWIM zinc finger family protein, partial [Nocardioides sp.]|nr:SWIM zinc finger family protein [Nocardioides sp.]
MLLAITDTALSRAFDSGSLSRGRSYARQGMVVGFEINELDNAVEIVGSVAGNRAMPYSVTVFIEPTASTPRVTGDCSCPVGLDCKHAVALLVSVRDAESQVQPDPPAQAWRTDLDSLLGEFES